MSSTSAAPGSARLPSGPGGGRARQVLAGFAALVVLLGALFGVPVLLAVLGGNPLPDHLLSLHEIGSALTARDDGSLFLRALTIAGWLGWVTFALSVLVELPAVLLRRPAPRLPGLRSQQRIAAALLATIALVAGSGPAATAAVAGGSGPAATVADTHFGAHSGVDRAAYAPDAPWSAAEPRSALDPTVFDAPPAVVPMPRTGSAPLAAAGSAPQPMPASGSAPGSQPASGSAPGIQPASGAATGSEPAAGSAPVARRIGPPPPARAGSPVDRSGSRRVGPPPLPVRAVSPALAGSGGVPGGPGVRPAGAPAGGGTYVVAPGDRLADVAARFLGDPDRYPELATASGVSDPDEILPGQRIALPAGARDRGASQYAAGPVQAAAGSYVVNPGDRLWEVADRFLGDPDRYPELAAGSGVSDPDEILPGQRIVLPPTARDTGTERHATGPVTGRAAPAEAEPSAPKAQSAAPKTGKAAPSAPSSRPTGAGGSVTPSAADPAPKPTAHADGLSPVLPIGVPLAGAGLLGALLLARGRRQDAFEGRHRRHRGERRSGAASDGFVAAPKRPRSGLEPRAITEPAANTRLDDGLRALAGALADRAPEAMPDVMGAWLEQDTVRLVLSRPCSDPPIPWVASELSWELPADAELPPPPVLPAPLPMLVTVGSRGPAPLLLDVERLGVLTITGDAWRADDLLRYLGAELASNPWSDDVEILVAGFDPEQTDDFAVIGEGRIEAVATVGDGIDRMRRRVSQALGLAQPPSLAATPGGRHATAGGDEWAPLVLLAAEPDLDETIALGELDAELTVTGRCGVGVVATMRGQLGRWPLVITAEGEMTAGFLGIGRPELVAARLSRPKLSSLAELMVDTPSA